MRNHLAVQVLNKDMLYLYQKTLGISSHSRCSDRIIDN